jgi:flagellar assembly factor FliW
MNCPNSVQIEPTAEPEICQMKLPMGLLGFEQIKDYVLVANPGEAPFCWLQVKDNPALAFVVVDPFLINQDYRPDISEPDVEILGLEKPEDAMLYNIVTLHGNGRATVNLKGPVVFNRHTRVGKQIIIANAGEYSVQHPLPLAENA